MAVRPASGWSTAGQPSDASGCTVVAALTGARASDPRSAVAEMLLANAARAGLTLAIAPDGLVWR